ncbi:uncharacterized protein PRD47_001032, partial [Ara ararauna]
VNGWGPRSPPGGFNPASLRPGGTGPADPRLRLPSVPRATRPRGRAGGGGPARGPPPGRRPALAGRISSAAVRRDRLRVGWEGLRRAGGPAPRERRPGVRAPGQQVSPNPGAEGEDRRRALPRPGGAGPPPAWRGGGPRPAGERGPGPPAPGAAVNRGGLRSVRPDRAAPPGRARPRSGARGPRRCRLPTRPVLKHGPRSLARARVRGRPESPRRNEGEGRRAPAEVGSRGVASEKPRAHHRPVSPVPPGRGGGA